MRITFDEIAIHGDKSCKCVSCGKRLTRSKKFWMTESPFNRNEDGSVRNRDEIYAALKLELQAWIEEPVTCQKCSEVSP